MFENIEDFIRGEETLRLNSNGTATPRDIKIAVLAILLKATQANGKISSEETNTVFRSAQEFICERDEEAGDLMEVALHLGKNQGKIEELVAKIREHYSNEQRQKILTLIWEIVKADKKIDQFEILYATEIRNLLGLTLEQAMAARAATEVS